MLLLSLWCCSFQPTVSPCASFSQGLRPVLCLYCCFSSVCFLHEFLKWGLLTACLSLYPQEESQVPLLPKSVLPVYSHGEWCGFVLCFPDTTWLALLARCFSASDHLPADLSSFHLLSWHPIADDFVETRVRFHLNFLLSQVRPSLSMLEMAETS